MSVGEATTVDQSAGGADRSSRRPPSVASAALLVMFLLMVGKFVGVIDDLVKARVFGTSADLDAFVAAGGLPETTGSGLISRKDMATVSLHMSSKK